MFRNVKEVNSLKISSYLRVSEEVSVPKTFEENGIFMLGVVFLFSQFLPIELIT